MSVADGWVAAGTVATALSAAFTAVMAAKTRSLASETQKMAEATRDDATASLHLVEQGRLSLEPILRAECFDVGIGGIREGGSLGKQFKVTNLGGGPALGCHFAWRDGDSWGVSAMFDVPPGAQLHHGGPPSRKLIPEAWWAVEPDTPGAPYFEVLFCRDRFHRRYRFLVGDGGHMPLPEIRSASDLYFDKGTTPWYRDNRLWGSV